eukprot:CAMPEP_0170177628 /NCGR_PEP_ID=MMETSP0040_2-20121228/10637_1 /TAXON_ID=641309 /ORGANISM="Lotharella oceanica, Strain CCMP622" /LENGTH=160 /DNA_ID=CAMNT_0010420325 /DNA_START=238 /DNA_END=721 /DNA_ORIENTATION=+
MLYTVYLKLLLIGGAHLRKDVEALHNPLLEARLHLASSHLGEALGLLGDPVRALALGKIDELELLLGASLGVLQGARDDQVLLRELLQLVERPPALVVLGLTPGLNVLDGGVALHAVLAADVLVDGAVDVADDDEDEPSYSELSWSQAGFILLQWPHQGA